MRGFEVLDCLRRQIVIRLSSVVEKRQDVAQDVSGSGRDDRPGAYSGLFGELFALVVVLECSG